MKDVSVAVHENGMDYGMSVFQRSTIIQKQQVGRSQPFRYQMCDGGGVFV